MRYILLLLCLIVGGIYMLFFKASPTSPDRAKIAPPRETVIASTKGNFLKTPLDRARSAVDQASTKTRENSF